ncbi:MAG TPA: hypothetical protein VF189_02025 [Patescibacteria group bacterium]
MKLPILSSIFKKTPPREYFLAFLLREEHVHAVVFEELGGRIQVIGQGKAELPSSLETISQEGLLSAADKAISIAEQSLPEGIQTHKTVFGVKESWVEDSHITKEYLGKLKQMSEELDLQPIGFLVFPEAIAHLLQKEEGAPVSGILIDIGKKTVSLTLIRAGRIVDTKEVPLTQPLTETVENALLQFENIEIFPSRLIIFDSNDKKIERSFISHHWSKSIPFLHVPQVSTLSPDFDTRAILFGTATQMGFDAIDLVKSQLATNKAIPAEELEEEKEAVQAPEEDIEEEKEEKSLDTPKEKEDSNEEENQEFFGFVKDEDIAKTEPPHPTNVRSDSFEEIPEEVKETEESEPLGFTISGPAFFEGAKNTFLKIKSGLPRNSSFTKSIFSAFSSISMPQGNKLIFLIPVILILVVIFFIWYIFGIHASATLSLTPKIIEQTQAVTFSTTDSTDTNSGTIQSSVVSASEDGKVSGSATGSKDVGDKAKGTITIFNSDSSSHSFSSGTTITCTSGCSSSLKFTLDSDVNVASGSSDPTNLSAGTANVNVTASDIGTDYNVPSGAKFSIGSLSSIAAKNDNPFSGGSKKTVTVVSQKDLDSLATQLTSNLSDKAKEDLQQQANSDMVILPSFTKTTLVKSDYDKKVGDEASTINLSGTVSFQSISYKKSDIDAYTKSAMQGQLPSDLTLAPEGITYDVEDLSVKNGTAKANLHMKAAMLPNLDTKTISGQIAGKSFAQAKEILSATPQFSDVNFKLSPNLFFLPQILPRLAGNISVSVEAAHE